jgi:medium-chain acyl-[acyl-carrier-protein] hydrolase
MATAGSAAKSWTSYPRPNPGARLRLFCLPYAGGGASIFRTWPAGLPAHVEVIAIQLPGRESRIKEQPYTRLDQLIQTFAHVLLPLLDTPFMVFGHSMGALIGFELARYLRDEYGYVPACLFVSGQAAPQLPPSASPTHALQEPAFLERIRRLNGTPDEVFQQAELLQLVLPVLRADLTVCETYIYRPAAPLNCPISAFGGLEDATVSHGALSAWCEQTSRSFTLRMLPGNHFFLRGASNLLLQAISDDLG